MVAQIPDPCAALGHLPQLSGRHSLQAEVVPLYLAAPSPTSIFKERRGRLGEVVPCLWVDLAVAQQLPQGSCQVGDRHLNVYETRDNLVRTV
jgi:hypothetical protein